MIVGAAGTIIIMECRCCKALGSDVRLMPCGCTMHAKCTPVQLFLGTNGLGSIEVHRPGQMACSFCGTTIQSVYIIPMTTELLDTAAAERGKLFGSTSSLSSSTTTGGDPLDARCVDESPYLLLTNNGNPNGHHSSGGGGMGGGVTASVGGSGGYNNREYRTGRFTDEEMELCEFLMNQFDKGLLPMGAGVRLNDFLCNMLLCKASRLTKKMKNAKLGSRSYELLSQDPTLGEPLNFEMFTRLQERFLNSVTSLSVRCELRFHMDKTWRSNLSSLCIQIGCTLLNVTDWISNLEEMEARGALAEENIRKARRRRMGLALKTDVGAPPGVYFSGVPVQPPLSSSSLMVSTTTTTTTSGDYGAPPQQQAPPPPVAAQHQSPPPIQQQQHHHPAVVPVLTPSGDSFHTVTSTESERTHHISNMLDIADHEAHQTPSFGSVVAATSTNFYYSNNSHHSKLSAGDQTSHGGDMDDTDFANFFDDLIEDKPFGTTTGDGGGGGGSSLSLGSTGSVSCVRHTSGSFLEEVNGYLERNLLPFQHADVWVPSYHPGTVALKRSPQDLRLFHSGHTTRTDVDPVVTSQLMEYGEYSTKFSFATGVGLPGRVFKTGESSWECRLDLADPKIFERAGGAGVYGVKTGVGLPMASSLVGRLVLCLYSLQDLPVDTELMKKLQNDLSVYCPKPTWKLVVEVDSESMSSCKSVSSVPPTPTEVVAASCAPVTEHNNDHRERRSDSLSVHSAFANHNDPSSSSSASAPPAMYPPQQQQPPPPVQSQRSMEIEIAKLLTDFLPGASLPGAMTDTDDGLLPFYMSLRLLLLRDPDRRNNDENNKLEVIRRSYEGFLSSSLSSNGNPQQQRRAPRDIADLIVRDWRFLRTNSSDFDQTDSSPYSTTAPAAPLLCDMIVGGGGHRSMVMNEPKVQTFAPSGAPARVPFALGDPNEGMNKKRRVSPATGQVNIVDDSSF